MTKSNGPRFPDSKDFNELHDKIMLDVLNNTASYVSAVSLWHNPLDNVMEKYDGMSILATDIMFEKGIDGDPVMAEEYLANWMKKYPANYWLVGDRIKISITHRGEDLANRKIHSRHQKKYRVMK